MSQKQHSIAELCRLAISKCKSLQLPVTFVYDDILKLFGDSSNSLFDLPRLITFCQERKENAEKEGAPLAYFVEHEDDKLKNIFIQLGGSGVEEWKKLQLSGAPSTYVFDTTYQKVRCNYKIGILSTVSADGKTIPLSLFLLLTSKEMKILNGFFITSKTFSLNLMAKVSFSQILILPSNMQSMKFSMMNLFICYVFFI